MVDIFKPVDKFFASLTSYLTYNYIFIVFVGLFLFSIFCVLIFTSRSYEAKLIKAIDKLNSYFIDNPQINEDNLVMFNNKMKSKKVPKQLRKSWQQFVLYREDKASKYMSFENCVSNPIKNSSYTRDVKLLNILAWIFSLSAVILNCYYCYEVTDIASALSKILLTPVIILLLNYLIQIFFSIRHSAIVSDLFQNYQYFEVNIDKATETLPEYVDYEVLFDRNEIKKGIPILYAYLQKRAEEEQRQLERARLKNIEHEKFNFDDQGVAASLVLERAMQEAENYIAERKKYTQDIGQINADITQEDLNYREITKEYNRQMQVSKETFANFKAQLEEVSSTIEANYLKKQQQQELDRQRNLERDFDMATEKHKKIIESYQAELDTIDGFIAQSRKNLEDAMKSEFGSYSGKVYDEARKAAEQDVKDKLVQYKNDLVSVEERLVVKEQQLKDSYDETEKLNEKLQLAMLEIDNLSNTRKNKKKKNREQDQEVPSFDFNENVEYQPEQLVQEQPVVQSEPEVFNNDFKLDTFAENTADFNFENDQAQSFEEVPSFNDTVYEEFKPVENDYIQNAEPVPSFNESVYDEFKPVENEPTEEFNFEPEKPVEEEEYFVAPKLEEKPVTVEEDKEERFNFNEQDKGGSEEVKTSPALENKQNSTEELNDSIEEKPASRRGRPRKVVDVDDEPKVKKGPGRPKKEKVESEPKVKRGPGRPKKTEDSDEVKQPKKGPGRPRKVESEVVEKQPKKGRGRPRKVETEDEDDQPKRGRGRPRKTEVKVANDKPKKGRGRPRKTDVEGVNQEIENIDAYLKEIDDAIAAENAKMEETQKELAKKAKLKRKK